MKSEADPITDDESVLRLIWHTYFTAGLPVKISDSAFTPKKDEVGGISLFRAICLAAVGDALLAVAPDKRPLYAVASLSVAALKGLGLTVSPDPIPTVAGHASLTEVNSVSWNADKAKWRPVLHSLAQLAQAKIVLWPNK